MEHTGRDIRVLVDLQAATKFRRLLAKALDLLILLPEKLVELLLRDNDLVVGLFRDEAENRIPSSHLPSGRGLTASRI
jgi:hypothetical protein